MSVSAGHAIAHAVHDVLEEQIPIVKHCMVHANPKQQRNAELVAFN